MLRQLDRLGHRLARRAAGADRRLVEDAEDRHFRSRPREDALCRDQVRPVDHLAVEADDAGLRRCGKRIDDPPRMRDRFGAGREDAVDDLDLVGMDRGFGREADPRAVDAFALEAGAVAEIGIDRVDRRHARRGRGEQAHRPRQRERRFVRRVGAPVGECADVGGKVLRTPHQAGQALARPAIGCRA